MTFSRTGNASILHADMDAFYASVEQHDKPELEGKPVVVGGSGRRGVVAAASYEARGFGVRSAMPISKAKSLCRDLCVVPPRMSRYAEISACVREIFYRFTPIIEPLSLDEAYMDVEGSLRLFSGMGAIAEGIREAVRDELGLAVSVGGGPGKLVAKIASRHAKPNGVLLIEPDRVEEFLHPLGVGEIWGVGPETERHLLALGITTIGDLARFDVGLLENRLGSWGPLLSGLARGEDLRTVECDRSRKSYGEENTFEIDVVDQDLLEATVIAHAETVARRMRRDKRKGRTVTLKYRVSAPGSGFGFVTRSRTIDQPTNDGRAIGRVVWDLWQREQQASPLRLVGVAMSGLDGERPVQLGLFENTCEPARETALNKALDDIIDRFGRGAVTRGSTSKFRQ